MRRGSRRLIAELETEPGGRVLDVGWGPDERIDDVSSLGLRTYSIDDVPRHGSEEGSFDVVRYMFDRIDATPGASKLRDLNRFIRPAGYLMLAVPASRDRVAELESTLQDLGHSIVARRPIRWRPDSSNVTGKFAKKLVGALASLLDRTDRHEWSFLSARPSCLLLTSRKRALQSAMFSARPTGDAPRRQNVEEHFDTSTEWQGQLYDEPTDRFARAVIRRQEYALELLRRNSGTSKPGRVLDAGCGGGTYLSALRREGWDVFGADLSSAMIEATRKRLDLSEEQASRRLKQSDVTSLPFENASFDAVVCVGVLAYVDEPARAISELTRVLSPGGSLVLSVDNMFSVTHADFAFRKWIAKGLGRRSSSGAAGGRPFRTMRSMWIEEHTKARIHYDLYDPWSLERWLRKEGCPCIDRLTFGFELRWLRSLGLLNDRRAESVELSFDRMIHRSRLPYVPMSGDVYIGVFRKQGSAP